MSGFLKNKPVRNLSILAGILFMLFGYTVYQDHKTLLESGAGAALGPVQATVYSVNKRVEGFIDFYLRYEDVKAENDALLEENRVLREQLREYGDLKSQNLYYRDMFGIKDRREEYDYLGANIINVSGGSLVSAYTIDRGEEDGLRAGMAVMTPYGIVGQVTRIGRTFATVESLSSENIAIHVTTLGDRSVSGIMKGYRGAGNTPLGKISYLSLDAQIQEGDIIVTSGLGGFYPPDIYVGKVLSVEEDRGNLMKTALVAPGANLAHLSTLFVVMPKDTEALGY